MEERRRISNLTGAFLIATAVVFDAIQGLTALVPIVPSLIGFTAWLVFFLWFKFLGITFLDSVKRAVLLFGAAILEVIPLVSALPAWSISVAITVAIVRMEDAAYNARMRTLEAQQVTSGAARVRKAATDNLRLARSSSVAAAIAVMFTLGTVASVPAAALAQFTLPTEQLTARMTPSHPVPREAVTVRVENYSVDLNRALISWNLNGEVIREGVGAISASFEAGPAGSTSELVVTAESADGSVRMATITIRPVAVDLLWEAQTYTPPHYGGRPLPASLAKLTLLAEPHIVGGDGREVSPTLLSYTWRQDGKALQDLSGFGKRSIITRADNAGGVTNISVVVTTLDGKTAGEASVAIPTSDPLVVLYEDDPLSGPLFDKPLFSNTSLASKELTVVAAPFFFSTLNNQLSGLSFLWRVNGEAIDESEAPQKLTLARQGEAEGRADVQLEVRHNNLILQSASTALLVQTP